MSFEGAIRSFRVQVVARIKDSSTPRSMCLRVITVRTYFPLRIADLFNRTLLENVLQAPLAVVKALVSPCLHPSLIQRSLASWEALHKLPRRGHRFPHPTTQGRASVSLRLHSFRRKVVIRQETYRVHYQKISVCSHL